MGKPAVVEIMITNSAENQKREFRTLLALVQSMAGPTKTENLYMGRRNMDYRCDNRDEFMEAVALEYPGFKREFSMAIGGNAIESGVHYDFEDKFREYYLKNKHMSAYLLQRFLQENYTNTKVVKAILHMISHYTYDEIGEYFVFPIAALINHENKGIKKFALKVFDNWNSVETLKILKGTGLVKEGWLNEYRSRIIERLEGIEGIEGKGPNVIFFTRYK